jgi:predicted nucleic acid-binding protein
MIVIADTAPLHYLVLIHQESLLPALYDRVFVPEAVVRELSAQSVPLEVKKWLARRPPWLIVRQVAAESLAPISGDLDEGERAAIALARQIQAELILIDDQAGRAEARRWKLRVTGTLGILRVAAQRGMIDVPAVIGRLRSTNFYLDENLISTIFRDWLTR